MAIQIVMDRTGDSRNTASTRTTGKNWRRRSRASPPPSGPVRVRCPESDRSTRTRKRRCSSETGRRLIGPSHVTSGSQVRALVRPPHSLPKRATDSSLAETPFCGHFSRVVVSDFWFLCRDIVFRPLLACQSPAAKIPFQTRRRKKVREEAWSAQAHIAGPGMVLLILRVFRQKSRSWRTKSGPIFGAQSLH